jgi:hypothetical protein
MAKWTIFSQPVFSLRPLTSLAATLCLASMLISTAPAYAAQSYSISVAITNLGRFHCAQIVSGNKLSVVTTNGGSLIETVTGSFTVDFYSKKDCTGAPGNKSDTLTPKTDAAYVCDGSQKKKTDVCTRIE